MRDLPRTALVTGASAGLGAEFARQLAARGCHLILVARREARLKELAEALSTQYNIRAATFACDLADPAAPQALFAHTEAAGLQVDYLINNAGAAGPDFLEERDWAAQRRFYELMMTSCVALCHAYAPAMRLRRFGRILNVASVAGRIARGGDVNYGPAKAYLVAFSEALHATVQADNVHVSALCPGFTHTEFHEAADMMEMKRATPGFIWYDAGTVVREGLRALEKGKPVFVSGRLYRWLDPLLQSVWTRRFFRLNR